MPERETLNTLTVGELRAFLDDFPDELPVMVAAPSGDYWGTTLALRIKEHRSQRTDVIYSAYHGTFAQPRISERERQPDDEDDEIEPELTYPVLLLE